MYQPKGIRRPCHRNLQILKVKFCIFQTFALQKTFIKKLMLQPFRNNALSKWVQKLQDPNEQKWIFSSPLNMMIHICNSTLSQGTYFDQFQVQLLQLPPFIEVWNAVRLATGGSREGNVTSFVLHFHFNLQAFLSTKSQPSSYRNFIPVRDTFYVVRTIRLY